MRLVADRDGVLEINWTWLPPDDRTQATCWLMQATVRGQ